MLDIFLPPRRRYVITLIDVFDGTTLLDAAAIFFAASPFRYAMLLTPKIRRVTLHMYYAMMFYAIRYDSERAVTLRR